MTTAAATIDYQLGQLAEANLAPLVRTRCCFNGILSANNVTDTGFDLQSGVEIHLT